jgi:hypothetical protein
MPLMGATASTNAALEGALATRDVPRRLAGKAVERVGSDVQDGRGYPVRAPRPHKGPELVDPRAGRGIQIGLPSAYAVTLRLVANIRQPPGSVDAGAVAIIRRIERRRQSDALAARAVVRPVPGASS